MKKIILTLAVFAITLFSVNGQYIKYMYFTDRTLGDVSYFDMANPSGITDFEFFQLVKPYGMVIDSANGFVFVSDATDALIYRFDLEGTESTVILDETSPVLDIPYGLAMYDNKVYWGREGGIGRCDIDGSNAELWQEFDLVSPPEMVICLAFNPDDNKMYFTNDKYDYSGGVYRLNMDGSGLEEIVSGTDGGAIAIDMVNDKIYYADWEKGICMANYDGSNEMILDPDYVDAFIWGLVVDPYGGKIYYADKYDNKILQADLDGSNRIDYLTGRNFHALAMYRKDLTSITGPITLSEKVYIGPNPVKDHLHISNIEGYNAVRIFNASGQLVLSEKLSGEKTIGIDMATFGEGLYFIYLSDKSGNKEITKIIKN